MTRVQVAAATDVGQVRSANEDSFLAGDAVFAVADGMGGHAAGEVASSMALEPLRALDGRVFSDATSAIKSLRAAVIEANAAVSERAATEPKLKGMGTTLTSALVEGKRLHIAHVGDSRAYLFRDDEFSQVTDDHTLVQHLIDAGQISKAEASSHPQRSVITRAIGVSPKVEVDTVSLELLPGDVFLLCSDGLTGVVSDSTLEEVLRGGYSLEDAAHLLIDMANERGGPDNITVVLLRGFDDDAGPPEPVAVPPRRTTDRTTTDTLKVSSATGPSTEEPWAERLGRLGVVGSMAVDGDGDGTGRRARITTVLIVTSLLVLTAAGGGRWLLSRSYFVGVDRGQVVIYQGVHASIGPIDLSWVAEETDLVLADVAAYQRDDLDRGINAADLTDARRIVANMPLREGASPTPTPSPSPAPTPSATGTPTPAPTLTPSPSR